MLTIESPFYEFDDVRRQFPGRDYAELLWLCSYLNSGGTLAQHLDPTAMYRLRRAFEVGRDYPAAARIVRELQRIGRAQDLASTARCTLGEVYNVQLERDRYSPTERRTMMDWIVRPQLRTVAGLA